MSDKTLGAYQRHETPDTARNADGRLYCAAERDEFACSREDGHTGPHVAAGCDLQNNICEVWDQAERHEKHDAADFGEAVAEEAERRWPHEPASSALPTESRRDRRIGFMVGAKWGRGSVWECPAPDQHNSAHDIDWQAVVDGYEGTVQALLRERDEARADRNDALHREKAEQDRAVRAERSRDLALARAERAECHDCVRDAAVIREPLTPEGITDEMVQRAMEYMHEKGYSYLASHAVKRVLAAALAEPPARPEGAYELETVIGLNAGKWTNGAEDVRALADLLASNGVRVVTEEQP